RSPRAPRPVPRTPHRRAPPVPCDGGRSAIGGAGPGRLQSRRFCLLMRVTSTAERQRTWDVRGFRRGVDSTPVRPDGRCARPRWLLGLVVEVISRRRIFVPMTRVTGVESGQIVITGVINMRRFEQRTSETLVLGELLDRRVRLVETGEDVTVLDIGITRLP